MWSRLEIWRIWVGVAVRVSRVVGVASGRVREGLVSLRGIVCGVLAGAVGVKLDTSLIDRNQVNTGTILVLPFPCGFRLRGG